ncbi:hypothetical protein JXD38_05040 [candidate division WOR-3 bacterium]|nr:hypothetical protein [candidate division WOR-3 bacterium]
MKKSIVMLCVMLGLVLAAGPANEPAPRVMNDVNPSAPHRPSLGPSSTFMDVPETVWTKTLTGTYNVGVTSVQDTLMWVSAGQTELRIYVFNIKDPARPLIDSFAQTGGPSGWGIRDMAWKASTDEVFAGFDNRTFHVYDATTHVPNNTYTISGYTGTVRGFGYSPIEDSCWTCDFGNAPMTKFSIAGANGHQVRASSQMGSAYGIAVDTLQHCYWISQAGTAGSSPIWMMDTTYAVVDSFNPTGWGIGGGIEVWNDTFLLALNQTTPDAVWCFKFDIVPPLDHDVGVLSITAPPGTMGQDSIYPIARIKNYGANPESIIPVTCWIDSLGTRVYAGTDTLTGPLAAGATAYDTFPTLWYSGLPGTEYAVTMFTELPGDLNLTNDTMVGTTQITGAIFSDTIRVRRVAKGTPNIDGFISDGEWGGSVEYDISDLAGRGGTGPQPAGSALAYYLYDSTAGFMYFAVDCPNYSGRIDYDQFGPYIDEDGSQYWSADSSEGNYWVEYVGGDSVIYRALLDIGPTIWLFGPVPSAVSVSSTTSGHLQFETKIPLGTQKWQLDVNPGDTAGYFQYVSVTNSDLYPGWWPQTLLNSNWANPQYYGTMIFETEVGVQESPSVEFALYKASPSIVRDLAQINYYVAGRSSVSLGVYDVTGKLVKTLASGPVPPGVRTAVWNRTDNSGRRVANGTYFYRLAVNGKSVSSKAIVLK